MIKFTKMHGLGNDYIYIDCTNGERIENIENMVQFLSDRHFGVGADGVIFIHSSIIADFKMVMYNADGSEAEMCGNGIRCVAKYVYDKKLINKQIKTIETKSGVKTLKLYVKQDKVFQVMVDMGEPIFSEKDIPVLLREDENVDRIKMNILDREFDASCISMGNPHVVIISNILDDELVNKYGPVVEKDSRFPERTNVEFVQIIDRSHIKLRVWERGTGETLACGTGACAAVVTCCKKGLIYRSTYVDLLRWKFKSAME